MMRFALPVLIFMARHVITRSGAHVRRIALGPTAGLIALTVFDLVIVVLTWRENRQQRRTRTEKVPAGSAPTHTTVMMPTVSGRCSPANLPTPMTPFRG
jgi:hypothetical protein